MATYQTKQLDEWDLIAFQQLGTEYASGDLINANLTNPDFVKTLRFDPNLKLDLPDRPTPKPIAGPAPWRVVIKIT